MDRKHYAAHFTHKMEWVVTAVPAESQGNYQQRLQDSFYYKFIVL